MKKKLYLFAFTTLFLACSLFAQDTMAIAGGDMDLSSSIRTTYSDTGRLLLDGSFLLTPQDEYEWTPILNGQEISKPDFYKLTGNNALYEHAMRVERKNRAMNVTGYSLFAFGTAFSATAFILYATGNEFITENIYPFAAAGLGTVLLSIPFISYERSDGVNISAAIQIANDYNRGK